MRLVTFVRETQHSMLFCRFLVLRVLRSINTIAAGLLPRNTVFIHEALVGSLGCRKTDGFCIALRDVGHTYWSALLLAGSAVGRHLHARRALRSRQSCADDRLEEGAGQCCEPLGAWTLA